ncbi:MAG: YCF48-related protein [Candidatus Zixiibacteriota bacterium]
MRQSKNCLWLSAITVLAMFLFAGSTRADNWELIKTPVDDNISGVWFVNPDTGFVVTSSGKVLRTDNGGRIWTLLRFPGNMPLEDVSFINGDTGIVCGRHGAILLTFDGGATWSDRSLRDTLPWLLSTIMLDSKTALVVGWARDAKDRSKGLLLRSTDFGRSWDQLPDLGRGYGELFYRAGSPVCFQSWGRLHYSRDLGATWQDRKTIDGKPGRAIAFYGTFGVIVGNQGMGAYTHDGGNSWTSISLDESVQYTSVALLSADIGYVAGSTGMLQKTIDGGKTWKAEKIPQPIDILDLCLIGNKLYAVGSDGGIIRGTVK